MGRWIVGTFLLLGASAALGTSWVEGPVCRPFKLAPTQLKALDYRARAVGGSGLNRASVRSCHAAGTVYVWSETLVRKDPDGSVHWQEASCSTKRWFSRHWSCVFTGHRTIEVDYPGNQSPVVLSIPRQADAELARRRITQAFALLAAVNEQNPCYRSAATLRNLADLLDELEVPLGPLEMGDPAETFTFSTRNFSISFKVDPLPDAAPRLGCWSRRASTRY